jgi:NADPH-dependent 2,4-dienoyl-CoA reductase/sulfur reductase-like enzyme
MRAAVLKTRRSIELDRSYRERPAAPRALALIGRSKCAAGKSGNGSVESSVSLPHVVIIGGGFGGLAAARALADAPVRITLIDRRNHHLFQPLLYQVATAALSASDIARPIRRILRRQANSEVIRLRLLDHRERRDAFLLRP